MFFNIFMVIGDIKALIVYSRLAEPSAYAEPSVLVVDDRPHTAAAIARTQGEWRPDPYVRHELRWFTGSEWTDQVSDGVQLFVDPPGWASTVSS